MSARQRRRRRRPLAARQGPIKRPVEPAPAAGCRSARSPANRSSRPASRRGAASSSGGPASGRRPWQVWRSMVDDAAAIPIAPCQEACPAGTDAGRYVGPDRPGPLRRSLCRRRRGQPVPVGLRLDLHRALRGGLPSRHARRADRHPDASSASPPSTASCRRSPRPARKRSRAGRDRRRRTRRHVGRLLPRPPRLRRDRVRGDAGPGRHDGDRHPRVPPAARGPPRGDRPHRRPRRRAAARHRHGPRLHPGRPRGAGLQGRLPGDRRLAQPPARRARRRPAGRRSRPPSSSSRSTSARSPRLAGAVVVVGGGSTAMDAARSASGAAPPR